MPDDLPIEQLGKGLLPQPPDERDFKFEEVFGAPQVDFTQEFRLSEPPNEHQGTSLSCVAQASSYFHWQFKNRDYSRRDLYSEIFIPVSGGAYLRDGVKRIADYGQATRDEVPDPHPQTESGMRNHNGVTREKQISDKAKSYFLLGSSIDQIAVAVRDFRGAVFGVNGNNAGWQNKTNPTPPAPGTVEWAHALYAMGYHMHNGMKCIIAKSSWCTSGHHEHHIKENYFNSGNTFDGWVLIPNEEIPMFPIKKVKVNGSYGVMIVTPNMLNISLAEDEAEWRSYAKADSYKIHSVNQDGSTDFSVDLEINF